MLGRARPFTCGSIWSAKWCTLTTAFVDAHIGEPVEHVIDQRLAADRDQRLRQRVGQRTHAFAEARRQHHGAVDHCVSLRRRNVVVVPGLQLAIAG